MIARKLLVAFLAATAVAAQWPSQGGTVCVINRWQLPITCRSGSTCTYPRPNEAFCTKSSTTGPLGRTIVTSTEAARTTTKAAPVGTQTTPGATTTTTPAPATATSCSTTSTCTTFLICPRGYGTTCSAYCLGQPAPTLNPGVVPCGPNTRSSTTVAALQTLDAGDLGVLDWD